MFTSRRVIHPSSPDPASILVAGENERGHTQNVTITDETLGAQLAETPAMIPNPAYKKLEAKAFALAEQQANAEE